MDKKIIMENGLRLVTRRMPEKQSVAVGVWIKTGGRFESEENKGISHFLEHLLFKGTRKYSCRQIKESIEGVGGSLNGFTAEEMTCYLVKAPARYLNLTLDILCDMVLHPSIPELEVQKERHVILEELKMYKDQPQSYVYELLDELLWPAHPLGTPIIGTTESVSKISRQDLADFQKSHYTASNIVVAATGALDETKLTASIKAIFSKQTKQSPNLFLPANQAQVKPQLKVFIKDTEQTHLAFGFHGLPRQHPLKHALGLLHVILGGNMSSRLFNEVREKRGLAYEIGAQVKRLYDTGAFIVHAGVDNRKLSEAITVILAELVKTRDKLVTEDEFKRAKDFYLGQLMLGLEDTMDYMLWIGESTLSLDRTYTLNDIVQEVKKVKREDLRVVAQQLFQGEKINLSVIGPLKGKEAEIQKKLSF